MANFPIPTMADPEAERLMEVVRAVGGTFGVRPGRRGRPDEEYARLAAAYVRLLGESKPVEALAEQEHLSQSQVRNLLSEAKRRKIITRPGQGRAGGQLTKYGRSLLEGGA